MIVQLILVVTGVVAIWLTQQKNEAWKKYACIMGMIGQPFWFISAYQAEQWGIFIVCFGYTYVWWLGIRNHWLK